MNKDIFKELLDSYHSGLGVLPPSEESAVIYVTPNRAMKRNSAKSRGRGDAQRKPKTRKSKSR